MHLDKSVSCLVTIQEKEVKNVETKIYLKSEDNPETPEICYNYKIIKGVYDKLVKETGSSLYGVIIYLDEKENQLLAYFKQEDTMWKVKFDLDRKGLVNFELIRLSEEEEDYHKEAGLAEIQFYE